MVALTYFLCVPSGRLWLSTDQERLVRQTAASDRRGDLSWSLLTSSAVRAGVEALEREPQSHGRGPSRPDRRGDRLRSSSSTQPSAAPPPQGLGSLQVLRRRDSTSLACLAALARSRACLVGGRAEPLAYEGSRLRCGEGRCRVSGGLVGVEAAGSPFPSWFFSPTALGSRHHPQGAQNRPELAVGMAARVRTAAIWVSRGFSPVFKNLPERRPVLITFLSGSVERSFLATWPPLDDVRPSRSPSCHQTVNLLLPVVSFLPVLILNLELNKRLIIHLPISSTLMFFFFSLCLRSLASLVYSLILQFCLLSFVCWTLGQV